MSSSDEIKSFLLRMCIAAPESTKNSCSSGFFEEGASITHTSVREWNVALSLVLGWRIVLVARFPEVSYPQTFAHTDGVLEVHTFE